MENKDIKSIKEVDDLAKFLNDFYNKKLEDNRNVIFGYMVKYKPKAPTIHERSGMRFNFNEYFKTIKQAKKTKHILSFDFNILLVDKFNNDFIVYFYVDKKEYELRGLEYLEEIKEHFITEINNRIKQKKEAEIDN